MKKLFCLLIAVLTFSLIIPTVLADDNNKYWFSLNVQCTSTDPNAVTYSNEYVYKSVGNKTIYVWHQVPNGSEDYTNLFHAVKADTGKMLAQKWVTPRLVIPVSSQGICADAYYKVAARGNTNHYLYDGLSRVTLDGYFKINYPDR